VKLLQYKKRVAELEASDNPFSVVVLAHLAAQATKDSRSQLRRRKRKLTITKMLYERGYSELEVNNIFRFIDWVLTLPKELEESFTQELIAYEDQKNMPYITSIERSGITKAHINTVLRMLNKKLGEVPIELQEQIRGFSIAELETLFDDLLDFNSTSDLVAWLSARK
jgi:Domain of unknown function (DUF4351)